MRARAGGPLLGILLLLSTAGGGDQDGRVLVTDPETRRPERRVHDVVSAEFLAKDGRLEVRLVFREDVRKGVFTLARLSIDCDNDPATGIDGSELQILAAVGSRYRALSSGPVQAGDEDPFEIRRASCRVVEREATVRGGREPDMWLGLRKRGITPPAIEGRRFVFSFPLSLLKENGLRYNDSVRLFLEAEGSISEEVISLPYVCDDEGITITVDGDPGDWPPGEPMAKDAEGDLHPSTQDVDLTSAWVDHDARTLFARVRLARSGLGEYKADDIWDSDRVYLGIEPVGDQAYMPYVEVVARGGPSAVLMRDSATEGRSYAIKGKTVEFAVPRRTEQTRFRVLLWSEAERIDRVPDRGTVLLKIPREAWEDE